MTENKSLTIPSPITLIIKSKHLALHQNNKITMRIFIQKTNLSKLDKKNKLFSQQLFEKIIKYYLKQYRFMKYKNSIIMC